MEITGTSSYKQVLDYLYEHLPLFSKLGKDAIKKDLTNIRALCEALQHPEQQFKSIHIAGTNGKGSVSHGTSALLQQQGYKVGLYTSPHLVDFRERIRINGQPVSKQFVIDFVVKIQDLIAQIRPSFFEVTVAMAFAAFRAEQVDYALIETGLGGRLDSTNIITPILSVITNISYDHTDVLGDTLTAIANEKAGIIKPGVPVIIGEQNEEANKVFFEHSIHKKCPLFYADATWNLVKTGQDVKFQYLKAIHLAKMEMYSFKTDLLGSYQQHNLKTILCIAEVLQSLQVLTGGMQPVLDCLASVKSATGLRGRWEVLQENPYIILDVGHNPAGIEEMLLQWQDVEAQHKHIVLGFVKDKDVRKALSRFPKDAQYYFCNADLPRALPAAELRAIAAESDLQGDAYSSVAEAVNAARKCLEVPDALLIAGSFFVVGEAISFLDTLMQEPKTMMGQ